MDTITPNNPEPSSTTSGVEVFQMSTMKGDRHGNGTITSKSLSPVPSVEDTGDVFQIPVEISNAEDPERRLKEFRARHIQMMALGSAIGAGLLFQSGKVLYLGGPVSLWLAYLVMGTVLYAVLITLGEMVSFLPIPGGFFSLATRCLSPAIGFACGWSYWFAYVLGFPAKLVAAQNIMAFWLPKDQYPPEIWISIFWVVPILFNYLNVRRYGEIEFWLTVTKVVTIVGIIILGILLPMGASPTTRLLGTDMSTLELVECPQNPTPGITCVGPPGFGYWREGAFREYLVTGSAGRFFGFWACCCQAVFSYIGTELIGIAADETERQRETLPKAVRRVSYRLAFYYVGAVFVLGLNVSANDPVLESDLFSATGSYASSFVLMVRRAGIPGLAHVINAVALIAVLSVGNANLYVSSRTLYALAMEGMAPKVFAQKNRWDVPYYAIIISALPAALAYLSVKVSSNTVFDFLSRLTTTCALIPWAVICLTYLRFRRAVKEQVMKRAIPPKAVSPFQPWLAIYGLAWSGTLIIFQGFEVFSRHNAIWAELSTSWGFTMAPWLAIGVLCFMVFAWIARGYYTDRQWTWGTPRLGKVDLYNGVAPMVQPDEKSKNKFLRALLWVLNTI